MTCFYKAVLILKYVNKHMDNYIAKSSHKLICRNKNINKCTSAGTRACTCACTCAGTCAGTCVGICASLRINVKRGLGYQRGPNNFQI